MAAIALGRGTDVSRGLGHGILGNECATVTGRAFSAHARMIHGRWRPAGKSAYMAGVTLCAGWNVNIGLGLRIGKIEGAAMATGTLANCANVVHQGRLESREVGVAAVALFSSWNVVGRFAQCIDAIVAIRTAPHNGRTYRCVVGFGDRCP